MRYHHSSVLKADRETLMDTLSDVLGLQRNVPGMANWVVRDGTISGQAHIATVPTSGVFECSATVVRSVSIAQPGVLRLSGSQRDGPIRWNATMDVVVVGAGSGATRVDVTADIRVSGAGQAIRSHDVEKALQAAVSALIVVGQAENGGREDSAQRERLAATNTDPIAFDGQNQVRTASTRFWSRFGECRSASVLLSLAVIVGLVIGRALPRKAARIVPRR